MMKAKKNKVVVKTVPMKIILREVNHSARGCKEFAVYCSSPQVKTHGILGFGISDYTTLPYELSRYDPACISISLCFDGVLNFYYDDKEVSLCSGYAIITPPHLSFTCSLTMSVKKAWVALDPEHSTWKKLLNPEVVIHKTGNVKHLFTLLRIIHAEQSMCSPDSDGVIDSALQASVILLRREFCGEERSNVREIRRKLEKAWESVNLDSSKTWTCEELATISGLSSSAFQKKCIEVYGVSPMRWVRRLRMTQASSILASNHSYGLAELGAMFGYETAFSFSRAFKREIGISPEEYKQKNKF